MFNRAFIFHIKSTKIKISQWNKVELFIITGT